MVLERLISSRTQQDCSLFNRWEKEFVRGHARAQPVEASGEIHTDFMKKFIKANIFVLMFYCLRRMEGVKEVGRCARVETI